MSDSVALLQRFYAAFAQRDWRTTGACYHDDVHFSDPAFDLRGGEARAMWHMLCDRGRDLRVESSRFAGDATHGSARWEAWYTFGPTGSRVHNVIDAKVELRDGLIVRHVDHFDFWRWSRQALGAPGWLLGWSPWLAAKVRAQARRGLDDFMRRTASRPPSGG